MTDSASVWETIRSERLGFMHIVKSVGVMSVAKITGLLYGCMGLIFAPFLIALSLLGFLTGQVNTPFSGFFGFVFAVLLPVLYGAMGFITGAIGALLYNLVAKWAGGFELELEVRGSTLSAPY